MGTLTPHFKSRVIHFGYKPFCNQALVIAIEFLDHSPFLEAELTHS